MNLSSAGLSVRRRRGGGRRSRASAKPRCAAPCPCRRPAPRRAASAARPRRRASGRRSGLRGGFLFLRLARLARHLLAFSLLGGGLVDRLRLPNLVELGTLVVRPHHFVFPLQRLADAGLVLGERSSPFFFAPLPSDRQRERLATVRWRARNRRARRKPRTETASRDLQGDGGWGSNVTIIGAAYVFDKRLFTTVPASLTPLGASRGQAPRRANTDVMTRH